jgi:thiosulfate/3-mercaptopyruvate sulfurtransferase
MFDTYINTLDLAKSFDAPHWVVIDCRFSLADTELGRREFNALRIPGAHYAHLDTDLSDPGQAGQFGRHPLPDPAIFAAILGRWGVEPDTQVVVYDSAGGMIAARLWWMLHWMGHEQAAVLDGGWQAWQQAGLPTSSDRYEARPGMPAYPFTLQTELAVDFDDVMSMRIDQRKSRLRDSRAPARYHGQHEPIDPVAGHIEGAQNAPHPLVVAENGLSHTAAELARHFSSLIEIERANEHIFYCGSGVTACRNILAVKHAGLGMPRLYPGSWSEWIARGAHLPANT